MNHEEASALLAEYLDDELDSGSETSVQEHLTGCRECQEVLATMRALRRKLARVGAAIFEPHPEVEELARYALGGRGQPTKDVIRIGAHVHACPPCQREVQLARKSSEMAAGLWARLLGSLGSWREFRPRPALSFSLAFLVVLLLYPAYLGVERFFGGSERAWDGTASLLYLSPTSRGVATIPDVRLARGQPTQAVVIAAEEVLRLPGDTQIDVELRESARGAVAWKQRTPLSSIRIPETWYVNLLVPAGRLAEGEYQVELREMGKETSFYQARFRVRRASED